MDGLMPLEAISTRLLAHDPIMIAWICLRSAEVLPALFALVARVCALLVPSWRHNQQVLVESCRSRIGVYWKCIGSLRADTEKVGIT